MNFSLYPLVPLLAFFLDSLLGDPRSSWHPVVLIGRVIIFWEKCLYREKSDRYLLLAGVCLVLLSLLTVLSLIGILLYTLSIWNEWVYLLFSTLILYITITPKALARDAKEIVNLLNEQNLSLARKRLSWIVGRDTKNLKEPEIARATIETVSENITDGIISPLFYFLLFGPLGALAYRVSNTLDSMVGYKNNRYFFFGRAAARWDDLLNYIPARITMFLLLFSGGIMNWNIRRGWETAKRDACRHPSPNGGYAEATVAGILGIRLGGYNFYQGKREFRAYMGDEIVPLNRTHILQAVRLMYLSTVLGVAVVSGILFTIR